ncbi:hypothetical protein F4860DRAFT_481683 [Xylaria cubensis]|nr:hypothetical protein F4860DRAFT_481683 [Xylaria cubensis]
MSSCSSTSRYSSYSESGSSRPVNYTPTITSIPGRCIHPSKLGNMLQARFGNDFSVEMRADIYRISARYKISYADIRRCY